MITTCSSFSLFILSTAACDAGSSCSIAFIAGDSPSMSSDSMSSSRSCPLSCASSAWRRRAPPFSISSISRSPLSCSSAVSTGGPPSGVFGGVPVGVLGSVSICGAPWCVLVSLLHVFSVGGVVLAGSCVGVRCSCALLACVCVSVFASPIPAGIRVSVSLVFCLWPLLVAFSLCALPVECCELALSRFRVGGALSVCGVSVLSAVCSVAVVLLYSVPDPASCALLTAAVAFAAAGFPVELLCTCFVREGVPLCAVLTASASSTASTLTCIASFVVCRSCVVCVVCVGTSTVKASAAL